MNILRTALCALLWLCACGDALAKKPEVIHLKVGDTPPPDIGKDQRGEVISLDNYRGRVVLMTFWASWCGPCRKEVPVLDRIQNVLGRDKLAVVAISFNEDEEWFRSLRRKIDTKMSLVYDRNDRLAKRYDIHAIPQMYVLDKQGKVAYTHRGYGEESLMCFANQLAVLIDTGERRDYETPDCWHGDMEKITALSYPPQERAAGHEGQVMVEGLIQPDGLLDKAKVTKSSGFPALDEAALRVASILHFTPGKNAQGNPDNTARFPVDYRLDSAVAEPITE